MPKFVTLTMASASARANQPLQFQATVSNTDAASATLLSLYVYEQTTSGAQIVQPQYLTPNVPAGVGNPILLPAASASYGFGVVCPSPASPGPSPNNPGGAAPAEAAFPANPQLTLAAQAAFSDGSVVLGFLTVPVLSAVAPFPLPQGGAAQFAQGGDSNLIAVIS
jgi:hypothetical protein